MRIQITAPAKINLSLDISGRRSDGYHLIRTVMQSIDLCDTVTLRLEDHCGISVRCSSSAVPENEHNIAFKAAQAFFKTIQNESYGVSIKIKKRIPVAAGLAGGSTDAAAVLLGLNHLLNGPLSTDELMDVAEQVGADVPFCIEGGTMLAEGIGSLLSPLPNLPDCFLVLAKPQEGVSTKEAYRLFDSLTSVRHPDVDGIAQAICAGNLVQTSALLSNVFEEVNPPSDVSHIKETMRRHGCIGCCMSGSGPSVFGLFQDKSRADGCISELKHDYEEVFLCRPLSHGCRMDG
ncbi:MAG: 4-(cytidine 5'-diphospho)-2-C-methyl-D-erythritol kinase [Clostridiales bacterium]|nr:4-(cytidine 5'-diphospho)-2-C-methyl-D-erythritol kinase [Clostridiales bacterium]